MTVGIHSFDRNSRVKGLRTSVVAAIAAIFVLCSGSVTNAEQNTGTGPRPPIGGGGGIVIGPNFPPGTSPCDPPQLPPGLLLPSFARGRIQETCGGVLRPLTNKPIKVLLNVLHQPISCDPNFIPPAVIYDVDIGAGTTDANGNFNVEFYTTDAGISPNAFNTDLKVRIIVLDDTGTVPIWETANYGQNSNQEFFVYEDVIYCLTEGTRIRIMSPTGDSAYDAELFVDGVLYPERTNSNGFITINPPLPAGTKIVARSMVHESASKRGAHAQGSDKNWKYRAYNTSMPLVYDANGDNPHFEPAVVTDPNGAYVLNLRRDACYIGLHFLASIEWDASPTELGKFASDMQRASEYFFNATDGQMLIERVDVFDEMRKWDESDFQVNANASLRANVDWPVDGFWREHDLCCWRSSHMNMSRSNGFRVYNHEFGHYGMLLGDEYEDDEDTHCATGVGGSNPLFDAGGDKASCMMFQQSSYTKICSSHPDNPHITGTNQGDEDCWSALKRHFMGESVGPSGAQRWRIQTPVDRGAIIGKLPPIPLSGWATTVEIDDANNNNLCQPVKFKWASGGAFANGARVFSKNSSGRMMVQGVTDATGVIMSFGGNEQPVAGLHVGDTIGATWNVYAGGGYIPMVKKRTFTDADCVSAMIVLSTVPGQAPAGPRELSVEGDAAPFGLSAQLEPGAVMGEIVVRVRADVELGAAPTVRLSVEKETGVRDVVMTLDATTGDWIGQVTGLSEQFAVVAEIEAVDAKGAKAEFITRTTFTGAAGDEESILVTDDGMVEMTVPAGAFAGPTQIAIGGSVAPLPNDFPGRIISGPIALTTGGAALAMPATLQFSLPFENEEKMLEQVDPSLLIVLAYDESTGLWNEIDAKFLHGKLAMEAETGQFGSFVLIERGVGMVDVEPVDGSKTDVDDDTGGANENGVENTPSSPVDIGTGACGAGAALSSSLMLAMIGARRIGRRNRGRRDHA